MERKLILYIASSLDGYIATHDDDLSFLELVQKEEEDYGYSEFLSTVDTVILGRRTYDWVSKHIESPYSGKKVYVITKSQKENIGNIVFYSDDLKELIQKLKNSDGKHIFCDGGAELVNSLLRENLFDELIISVIPILLGDGIRLFKEGLPQTNLELVSAKTFSTGLVQLHYLVT